MLDKAFKVPPVVPWRQTTPELMVRMPVMEFAPVSCREPEP